MLPTLVAEVEERVLQWFFIFLVHLVLKSGAFAVGFPFLLILRIASRFGDNKVLARR